MNEAVSVIIPVLKGREWRQERATTLPPGTNYQIVMYDEPDEWADAMNAGVENADTPLVILSAADCWFEQDPQAVEFLADLCWNADVTYGQEYQWNQAGEPVGVTAGEMFCPNRLRRRNYLPSVACVRRDRYLEVGGVKTGMWDLWLRLLDAGCRFKYVGEAEYARDELYIDESPPPPEKPDLKATFYFQATPGCAYWRCLLPARYLPGQAQFNAPPTVRTKNGILFPDHVGAAVLQYTGDDSHHELVLWFKELGIRVLAEVDDNYTHFFPRQMNRAQWLRKKEKSRYSVEQHIETAGEVDGVIVTTEHLAKMYRGINDNVFVCPNQIDPADWPEPEKPNDGVLRIGWFASESHRDDGRLIERAMTWASEQPNVEVTMLGLGVTNGKAWYPMRFRHVPWSNDFGVYRRFLGQLDIGLCPVVGTPWAVCRSDLKALEYGAAGAYPVVSDQPPYDTVDVPKAKTPKDFLRIVQELVGDPDGTREKARKWREYVLKERTVEANIDKWERAIWKA